MTTAARRLELVPLDELVPADRNPKLHDDEGIAASLDAFGFVEPVVLDERTGRLVVGHGRWEGLVAKRDGGAVPPEGIVVDKDGTWRVPVLRGWSSDSDDQAAAYLVAANRLTMAGGWDDEALAAVLEDLAASDMLDVTGFLLDDIAELIVGDDDDEESIYDDTVVGEPETVAVRPFTAGHVLVSGDPFDVPAVVAAVEAAATAAGFGVQIRVSTT
jgi:hypothetical protein